MKVKLFLALLFCVFCVSAAYGQVRTFSLSDADVKINWDRLSAPYVTVGDFNLDGRHDLMIGSWVRVNRPGQEYIRFLFDAPRGYRPLAGDFDGDGNDDIAFVAFGRPGDATNDSKIFIFRGRKKLLDQDSSPCDGTSASCSQVDGEVAGREIAMDLPNKFITKAYRVNRQGLPDGLVIETAQSLGGQLSEYEIYLIDGGKWLLSKDRIKFSEIPSKKFAGGRLSNTSSDGGDFFGQGRMSFVANGDRPLPEGNGSDMVGVIPLDFSGGDIKTNAKVIGYRDGAKAARIEDLNGISDISDDGMDDVFVFGEFQGLFRDRRFFLLYGGSSLPDNIDADQIGVRTAGVQKKVGSIPSEAFGGFDLNGDGKMDFIVADTNFNDNTSNSVHLYLSGSAASPELDSSSGFEIPSFSRVQFAGISLNAKFAVGKLVGDDNLNDLVISAPNGVYLFSGAKFADLGDQRIFLPGTIKTTDFSTGVAVGNPTNREARVKFKGYDANGTLVAESNVFTLAPGTTLARHTHELFSASLPESLSVVVESDITGVNAFALIYAHDGSGMDGAVALRNRATDLIFPELKGKLMLHNPNGLSASVTLRARKNDGSVIGEVTRALAANGGMFERIDNLFSSTEAGYLEVQSTLPLVGGTSYGTTPDFHWSNALRKFRDISGRGLIAHFAVNIGGYESKLRLINIHDKQILVTVRGVDAQGKLIDVRDVQVPAQGQKIVDIAELFELGNREMIGYLKLSSDNSFLGLLDFGIRSRTLRATVPMQHEFSSRISVSHVGHLPGVLYHGLTMVNLYASNNEVAIKVYDKDNRLTGQNTVILAPNEYRPRLLNEWLNIPNFSQAGGSVVIEAQMPIAFFTLFGDTNFRFLTTVLGQ